VKTMTELQICMLGPFTVCRDFVPVAHSAWRDPLAPRLLKAVLIARPDPLTPELTHHLVGTDPEGVRLAAAVAAANRVLHPCASLAVSPQGFLAFQSGGPCWIDVDALQAHYDKGVAAFARGNFLPAMLAFQEADALCQGDLLEEVQDPWVQVPRRRLQALYTDLLDRLAEGHAVLARYQDAVGFCHKALAHDRLREPTYQRMMVYYYYLGDLNGAAEAYQACAEALAGAGRPVSGETVDLWARLSRSAYQAPGEVAAASEPPPPVKRPQRS
jgi:DNA-binding SARP family transcriptional activator